MDNGPSPPVRPVRDPAIRRNIAWMLKSIKMTTFLHVTTTIIIVCTVYFQNIYSGILGWSSSKAIFGIAISFATVIEKKLRNRRREGTFETVRLKNYLIINYYYNLYNLKLVGNTR